MIILYYNPIIQIYIKRYSIQTYEATVDDEKKNFAASTP